MDPILGATWADNPYTYAGNDPLHAVDPLGLRPVTDAELADYTHRHHTGSFWERNGTAMGGAALFVAGAVVAGVFPGVGTVLGGAMMGAGDSMVMQGLC